MSVATELRQFLIDQAGVTISNISQNYVPKKSVRSQGFIYFRRRTTDKARTFEQEGNQPEGQVFDVEIYHEDPDVLDSNVDAIQALDCYNGTFGSGTVMAFFVEGQTDDYVPTVEFTDDELMFGSFLEVEVRSFRES